MAILLIANLIFLLSACSSNASVSANSQNFKGQTLNLLTWEGYGDKKIITDFEKKYGVKINVTYFGSSDELIAKLKSGGGKTYDIISPSSDVAGLLVNSDMVEPVDLNVVTNYKQVNSKLKLPDVQKNGKVYGVPYLWGPDYLIYDSDVIKKAPTSWKVLSDPKYKGKVSLWDDINNIYMIGQINGWDKKDKSALYNMSAGQLQQAKNALIKMKPQVRKYWATAGELNDLFANKEVDLAVGWPLTVKNVNDQGRNLKWTIPAEGATGWIDRLMIVKGSQHVALAQRYLNYALSAKGQALSASVTDYSVANKNAKNYMSKDLQNVTNVNDMEKMFNKLNFWQYVKNRAQYNTVWTEVKSAN